MDKQQAGRELDEKVAAQVFGWTGFWKDGDFLLGFPPSEIAMGIEAERQFVPHFSTNLEMAWEVLEHVASKTRWWEMARRPFKTGKGAKVNLMGDPAYDVYGETVPLAICLAALKTLEHHPYPFGDTPPATTEAQR